MSNADDKLTAAANEEYARACERREPFYMLAEHLTISLDGDQWCVLFGENLQDGVAGFGPTPEAAARAFSRAWCSEGDRYDHTRFYEKDAFGSWVPKKPEAL